jgi:hypothetical protein
MVDQTRQSDLSDSPTSPVVWTVRPAATRPGLAAAGVAIILAFGALAWFAGGGVFAAIVSVAGLFLATNRFFLPTRYVVDSAGVTANYAFSMRMLPWSEIRWFGFDDRGGVVSTRSKPSRLADRRAISLAWGEERERAVAMIRAKLRSRNQSPATPVAADAIEPNPAEAPACAG